MTPRTSRAPRSADVGDIEADELARQSVNEVRLRGRLAVTPEQRELPSGDVVMVFRLVVDRPLAAVRAARSSARVDTIDCAAFRGDVRRRIARWQPGDIVELEGSVRRRFFRVGVAATSRYEVEVSSATRVAPAPRATRATMAE